MYSISSVGVLVVSSVTAEVAGSSPVVPAINPINARFTAIKK
jgi:hypothetical protein